LSEQTQELDRKDLKILGYRQKLSELEEKFNELQVDFTIVSEQLQSAVGEIERLNALLKENNVQDPNKVDADGVSSGDVPKD
jgi:chromosome segregation ATPase